jgi:serine phosphatase RsbU (regulator of sigma subunit)
LGHTLVSAASGEEALKCLLRDDFAVILMDVFMPGMDGFETAQLIHQREKSQATPIVFLTALGTSETHVFRGYSVGAVDYLLKPLVPEILRSKVSAFVDLFLKTLRVAEQAMQLRELERQCHLAELAEAQRQLEVERLERDMRAARQVQQVLFPARAPSCEGFDIAGVSYPADATGGDYYDYIPSNDGCLDIVIGDVSGHGLSAALVMSSTRAYLRGLALASLGIDELLSTANRALVNETEGDRFVTLLYVRLSPGALRLSYTSAGHPPAYVMSASGGIRGTLESTAIPLGILVDEPFPVGPQIELASGDVILLLTDGVTEAFAPSGEAFGIDRALRTLRESRARSAAEIIDDLYKAVKEFSGESELTDDITAVVIKVA